MKPFYVVLIALTLCQSNAILADTFQLAPAASPADNPLKGLVPYSNADVNRFPHSLEFDYLKWSDLMVGHDTYDWRPLESRLNEIASRGCQAVFRVWIEYPNKPSGLPDFLRASGVKTTEWINAKENPPTNNTTPDYEDERLVTALERFIQAFGQRYDGDKRLGFLTAGLLGAWGEWHDWPREKLFASKQTQMRVLDAYTKAFRKTPVLLRYPAGASNANYAANDHLPFGYHDDSFAWGTLETGKQEDSWFYMSLLANAGDKALLKWQRHPIGGEIRPEVWGQVFDAKPSHQQAQDFAKCVQQTHASWLMDSGMFGKKIQRRTDPTRKVASSKDGLRLLCSICSHRQIRKGSDRRWKSRCSITESRRFYYDWQIELAALVVQWYYSKSSSSGMGSQIRRAFDFTAPFRNFPLIPRLTGAF